MKYCCNISLFLFLFALGLAKSRTSFEELPEDAWNTAHILSGMTWLVHPSQHQDTRQQAWDLHEKREFNGCIFATDGKVNCKKINKVHYHFTSLSHLQNCGSLCMWSLVPSSGLLYTQCDLLKRHNYACSRYDLGLRWWLGEWQEGNCGGLGKLQEEQVMLD